MQKNPSILDSANYIAEQLDQPPIKAPARIEVQVQQPKIPRRFCDECGRECGSELVEVRTELPDYPHFEYTQAWVSDCCEATYHYGDKHVHD